MFRYQDLVACTSLQPPDDVTQSLTKSIYNLNCKPSIIMNKLKLLIIVQENQICFLPDNDDFKFSLFLLSLLL